MIRGRMRESISSNILSKINANYDTLEFNELLATA